MLGPGKRVAGDEMDALGDMRRDGLDHRLLDGPDVRDRGTGLQMRADFGGDRPHRADRHRQDDKVRAFDCLGGGCEDLVAKTDLARGGAGFGAARMPRDRTGQPRLPHCMRHGGGDQPQPDQSDAAVDGLAHFCPLNCPMAWATRRQDASSPMVMRRLCGSP